MTTDEKLQHFKEASMEESRAHSHQLIAEYQEALDKIFADHKEDVLRKARLEIKNETDKTVKETVAKANAEAEKIKAEGEAQYMQILSEAYNDEAKADFYNYVRALDALKASLTGDNKTIILDGDSELARVLSGNEGF